MRTCFCFNSVSTPMRSFSCSFSSSVSSPFAYSSGNWISRSITSFTTIPSADSFCVIMPAARCRTSSRFAENTSRTV